MAYIDWTSLMNGGTPKKRYSGANVKFFNSYNENKEKSLKAGRAVFDEIPSISIQWPGGDETVRKIEPQDIAEYPEQYAAFAAGSEPITEGTPLSEWPLMNGSTLRELQHIGFRTIEQLAAANDETKRKLGPTGRFIKMAKDWLDAANSSQFEVVSLKQQLEREQKRTAKLEEQVELLIQRVESNEGTDLRARRKEVIRSVEVDDFVDEEVEVDEVPVVSELAVKRRGRPRKV